MLVEHRDAYLDALERASVEHDIGPFADFLAEQLERKPEFSEEVAAKQKR